MNSLPGRSRRNSRVFLVVLDFLWILGCFSFMYLLRVGPLPRPLWEIPTFWGFAATLLVLVYIFGAYEVERFSHARDSFVRIGIASAFFAAIASLMVYLGFDQRAGFFGRGVLLGGLAGFFAGAGSARWIFYSLLNRAQKRSAWVFAVSSRWLDRLKKDLEQSGFHGQIDFLTENDLHRLSESLGSETSALVIGFERKVFEDRKGLFSEVLNARVQGHQVMDLTSFYERYWLKIPVQVIAPEWLVQADGFSLFHAPVQLKFKRVFDLLLSVFLLAVTSPLMVLAAIVVKLDSPGPILFRQVRTGRDGSPFTIFKFRSMRQDAEKAGAQWAQVSDPRVTRVGNFLRKSRIDELPQILNVLRGEMSFIGPRPERPEFNEMLEKEIPYYRLRHLVNPGITGWAQILYPYGASTEDAWEKLQYDLFYIKNYSFWL